MRVALAAVLVVLVAGCGSASRSSAPAPSGPPTNDLRIGLLEFRLALSAGSLIPGPVTVTVTNAGSTGHDVRFRQAGKVLGASQVLSPGDREELRLDIAAGTSVKLDCTVGGHAEAGMHAELPVAAP